MRYRLQQQNLIVWYSRTKKQEEKKYRRQCPATNGNRSSGEAEEKEGRKEWRRRWIELLTSSSWPKSWQRRAYCGDSSPMAPPDDAEISVNWEEHQFRCHNRTEHSTADVEEIEVIAIEKRDGSTSAVFNAHKTGKRSYCSVSEVSNKKCSMRDFFHRTGSAHTPNPRERERQRQKSRSRSFSPHLRNSIIER